MRRLLTTSVLLLLACQAQAESFPPLVVAKDGIYYLTTDATGKPVLTRATNVVVMDGGGGMPVPPTDGPDVPVSPTDPFTEKLAAEVARVNHPKSQAAIGLVYRTIGEYVRDGKLRHGDASTALGTATDQILTTEGMGGTERWKPLRAIIGSEWNRRLQNGDMTTQQETSKFILDVAKVLETPSASTTPDEAAAFTLTPEQIDMILQIIKFILSVFTRDAASDGPV